MPLNVLENSFIKSNFHTLMTLIQIYSFELILFLNFLKNMFAPCAISAKYATDYS